MRGRFVKVRSPTETKGRTKCGTKRRARKERSLVPGPIQYPPIAVCLRPSPVFNPSVPAAQPLLFPDPQPLVERLGREFFRSLPQSPGVYLMRDVGGTILYVGKAKNLRKRLGSYRVANPDRLPQRHLRLLRSVVQIELVPCPDEKAALRKEAELLQTLRPKYNRAGTWRPQPRYLAWRCTDRHLQFAVLETPPDGWRCHGPLGSQAKFLRLVLVRMIWLAVHPAAGMGALPCGWVHGQGSLETEIDCGPMLDQISALLEGLLTGQAAGLEAWLRERITGALSPFELAWLESELEMLRDAFPAA